MYRHPIRRSLTARLAALLLVVLATGCREKESTAHHGASPQPSSGSERIIGQPITDHLDDIDAEHRGLLEFSLQTVPTPLPKAAVSLIKYVDGAVATRDGLSLAAPRSGHLRTKLVLADPGSNRLSIRILCLLNFLQSPCASRTRVWEVILPPSTLASVPIEIAAKNGDRIDLIVLIDGDRGRPQPGSLDLFVSVGKLKPWHATSKAPPHGRVFGGCGFATLQASDTTRQTFHPFTDARRPLRPYLIVQAECTDTAGSSTELVRAVQIEDGSTVVALPGFGEATTLTSAALVLQLPTPSPTTHEVRVLVLREHAAGWLTHPLTYHGSN
jgi:hypothetical protein